MLRVNTDSNKMKKYKNKREVLAIQWTGDDSIIEDVKRELDRISAESKFGEKFSISKSEPYKDKVLCLIYERGDGSDILTSTFYVYINNYIVIDLEDDVYPLSCYDEEYLNEKYAEI